MRRRESLGRYLTCEEEVAVEWDRVEEWVVAAGEAAGWEDLSPRDQVVIAFARNAGIRSRMKSQSHALKSSALSAVRLWCGNSKGKETRSCREVTEQGPWDPGR